MRITVNLDNHTVALPASLRVKAGAQAQFELSFQRDGAAVSLGDSPQIEVAFKARTGGGIVVFADDFDAAAGPSYSGIIDFNDTRLLNLLGDRQQIDLLGEILWVIGENRFRATNFGLAAEAPLIAGPESSESGPVYLSQTGSDARYARREANLGDLADAGEARENLGLGNVDNTADADKPISSAQAAAFAGKADLVSGKVPVVQLPLDPEAQVRVLNIGAADERLTLAAPDQIRAGDCVRVIGRGGVAELTVINPDVAGSYAINLLQIYSDYGLIDARVVFDVGGAGPAQWTEDYVPFVLAPIPENATQAQIAAALADAINAAPSLAGMLSAQASGATLTLTGLVKDPLYPEAWDHNQSEPWASVATVTEGAYESREVYQLNNEDIVSSPDGWGLLSEVLVGPINPNRLSGAVPTSKGGTGSTSADDARKNLGVEQTLRWTPTSAGSGKWYRILDAAWWKKSGILSITGYNPNTWHAAASVVLAFSGRAYASNGFTVPIAGGSVLFSGQHVPPWFPTMARIHGGAYAGGAETQPKLDVFIPNFSGTASELVFKLYENPTWCDLLASPIADPLVTPWDVAASASGSGSSLADGTYEVSVSSVSNCNASPTVQIAVAVGQNIVVTWTRQTGDTNTRIWLRKVGDTNWSSITPASGGSHAITSYTPGSSSLVSQGYTAHLDLTSSSRALGAFLTNELVIQNNLGRATRLLSASSSGFRAVQLPDANCSLPGLVAVPASATASGVPGSFAYDSSFFYTCVATNTWRRTPLAAW